jgi:hypothetical protein
MAVQVLATAFEAAGGAELKLRKLSLDGTLLGDAACMHLVKVGMRVCSCVSVFVCLCVGVLHPALLELFWSIKLLDVLLHSVLFLHSVLLHSQVHRETAHAL